MLFSGMNILMFCLTIIELAVTEVVEITPEQSSLSLTTSLKLFITQMHDCGFGLIGPRQVHAEYKMHTCRTIYTRILCMIQFIVRNSTPGIYRGCKPEC